MSEQSASTQKGLADCRFCSSPLQVTNFWRSSVSIASAMSVMKLAARSKSQPNHKCFFTSPESEGGTNFENEQSYKRQLWHDTQAAEIRNSICNRFLVDLFVHLGTSICYKHNCLHNYWAPLDHEIYLDFMLISLLHVVPGVTTKYFVCVDIIMIIILLLLEPLIYKSSMA